MDLNKDNMKKIMLLILFAVLLLVGVQRFDVVIGTVRGFISLISPFILGGCIAFIMNVPMRVIERNLFRSEKLKRIKRPISILLTLIAIVGVIFIVMFIILPELARTIVLLGDSITEFPKKVQEQVTDLVNKYPEIQSYLGKYEVDWNTIGKSAVGFVQGFTSGLFNSTIGVVSSIVSGVANFIIGFVFAIYILAQKENLTKQCKEIIYSIFPEQRGDKIIAVFHLAENTFANFLSGQVTEAVILGCMFFITMTIFKFPYALLVGVLIAFTALIPIFGAFIGCIIGAFLILMINPIQALWFVVLFIILQQIEGNLIYPHVVGGSVGLPSIWVLVAVTLGGNLMGIAGMLIFIPLCSVLYALSRVSIGNELTRRGIKEEKLKPNAVTLEKIVGYESMANEKESKEKQEKKVNQAEVKGQTTVKEQMTVRDQTTVKDQTSVKDNSSKQTKGTSSKNKNGVKKKYKVVEEKKAGEK